MILRTRLAEYRSRARAVGAATASNTVALLPVFLLGALGVFIRADLEFSEARLGLAVAVFFTASAVSSTPGGYLSERLGGRSALLLAASFSGACCLGIALLADSWPVIAGLLAVGGVGNGIAQPAANLSLARTVRPGRLGIAFGIKQSAILVSTLLAGLAVPLLALTVGWRFAFVVAAGLAVALWPLLPRGPVWRSSHRVEQGAPGAPSTGVVLLAVASASATAASSALGVFLVESAVAIGISAAPAGMALSAGSAAGILARLSAGWFADRGLGRPLRTVAIMLAVGGLGFLGLAASETLPAFVGAAVVAFAAGWGWPGLFVYAVVRLHPEAPAAATGVTQTGFSLGAVAGPALFGSIVASYSFVAAWSVLAGLVVVAAALMLAGRALLQRPILGG